MRRVDYCEKGYTARRTGPWSVGARSRIWWMGIYESQAGTVSSVNGRPQSRGVEPSRAGKREAAVHLDSTRTDPPKRPRSDRSRENTRRKLINAALTIMATKGVDGTSIADIAEAADVGFGSFYNHFKSKSEIAEAIFSQRAIELGKVTDAISAREVDKAVAIAYIQKMFLTKAISDPVWGWFIVRVQLGLPQMVAVFEKRANADLEQGIEQGRFALSSIPTATRIILAGLMAVTQATLEGEASKSAASETIECFLRMLGVAPDEARELSRRKLPGYVVKLMAEVRRDRESS